MRIGRQTDSSRIFVTAWLVYAAFWNPWLQSSMTFNFLDAAVSFVDTGRWEMAHPQFYQWFDTATLPGRVVSAEPPGVAVVLLPLYWAWRSLFGLVDTVETFQQFNGAAALLVGATASAFVAVQAAWLAGWLGAGRCGRLWTAALVAFGTQGFYFGTTLYKENLAACAVITSFRLAVEPGGSWRRVVAGAAGGLAVTIVHPTGFFLALLALLVGVREKVGRAAAFCVGCAPFIGVLAIYNQWLFGKPWLTGYYFITDLATPGFVPPKIPILVDLLIGPSGGLFLYAPFLLCAVAGVIRLLRTERQGEAIVAGVFLVGLWLLAASWQSQFSDNAICSQGLGPRMLFPGVPLLAAFAGPYLEHVGRNVRLVVVVPSIFFGYLSAQAGLIPGVELLSYAVKTWISGAGMGILFKEALPLWFGLDTLHTIVGRPDVTAGDVLRLLPTAQGMQLMGNQALFLALNLAVLGILFLLLKRIWQR